MSARSAQWPWEKQTMVLKSPHSCLPLRACMYVQHSCMPPARLSGLDAPEAAAAVAAPALCSQHYKRLPVGQVVAGQTAALALKKIKRQQVRHTSSTTCRQPCAVHRGSHAAGHLRSVCGAV